MPGRLMLAVAARAVVAEDREDHLRLEAADDPHGVGEQHLLRPLAERLRKRAGIAEVEGAGEVLPRAVDAARGEQLFGAQDAQRLAEVGPDEVLSAFTPRQRKVRSFAALLARDQCQRRGVLVVWMGADDQQAAVRRELGERPVERRVAAGAGRLVDRWQDVGVGRHRRRTGKREQGGDSEAHEKV